MIILKIIIGWLIFTAITYAIMYKDIKNAPRRDDW